MSKTVKTIPPKLDIRTREKLSGSKRKRRVAAYARVSTELEEQQNSYEAQIEYYSNLIKNRVDWEYVDVYADEGITGTNTRKREGFQRMVQDALDGKIDLILTKSVSRFARNTVDSLSTIRELKENGVEVWFEKENIQTFDAKGELLITIMSSLAQEESRSISENVKWGIHKKYSDGKYSLAYNAFLGYDKGPDGTPVINPEQAEIVKRIFKLFLQGFTYSRIAQMLTDEGVETGVKGKIWYPSSVKLILQNEKYKGDALLQKTYSVDFLSKQTKRNRGEMPQYYIENDHEAIIPPHVFDLVQELIKERKEKNIYMKTVRVFSGRIFCGKCGSLFGSKVWHSNDKYRKVVWQCNQRYSGSRCNCPHLEEKTIEEKFIQATNQMLERSRIEPRYMEAELDRLFDTKDLKEQREALDQQLAEKAEEMNDLMALNSSVSHDQERFAKKYDLLTQDYLELENQLIDVTNEINRRRAKRSEIDIYLETIKDQDLITSFEPSLWYGLVKRVTVNGKDDLTFHFKDGSKIQV